MATAIARYGVRYVLSNAHGPRRVLELVAEAVEDPIRSSAMPSLLRKWMLNQLDHFRISVPDSLVSLTPRCSSSTRKSLIRM